VNERRKNGRNCETNIPSGKVVGLDNSANAREISRPHDRHPCRSLDILVDDNRRFLAPVARGVSLLALLRTVMDVSYSAHGNWARGY
jgi:hypothetical protein